MRQIKGAGMEVGIVEQLRRASAKKQILPHQKQQQQQRPAAPSRKHTHTQRRAQASALLPNLAGK